MNSLSMRVYQLKILPEVFTFRENRY